MTEAFDRLRRDCRHFRGERPCEPHKKEGVACEEGCPRYDPRTARVLVVKLAAPGDVLRTTTILPALEDALGRPEIVWATGGTSVPLLEGNPRIHRIVPFRGSLPVELAAAEFDLVLNPDASPEAAALASAVRAGEKRGLGLDAAGRPYPFNPEAEEWLLLGLDDKRKKANQRSYPEIVHAMFRLPPPRTGPLLHLGEGERAYAKSLARSLGFDGKRPVVGLNTGAGARWQYKKWEVAGFRDLAKGLAASGVTVLLLGGPEEVERNRTLARETAGAAIETGCGHTMRQFAAVVGLCDCLVTGDTLALHLACALGIPSIALFGPTSAAEVDLRGKGEKIVSDSLDCLVCYKTRCDFDPHCMNTIPASRVEAAVRRHLRLP
ncbi:MAG: glycosyltransferase family 9 protein [Planctomycetes bacterium]|nr:glycosyltransferase family 9 protein [Planctomycetota bacterium]